MKKSLAIWGLYSLLFTSVTTKAQTKFQSLNFIYSIQGKQILSGQHNDQKNLECGSSGATNENYWTEQVHTITGKYPALYSGDFLFSDDINARWAITYEAERQWNAGAVVQMMWHNCPPTGGSTCGWNPGVISSLNTQEWAELLTDGSNLNNTWKARVDAISIYLQYLKTAGVEVLWRPYHEQNQTAFWWNSGGPGNTKALFRMLHDYMTNVKGLDNLIWVWDVQDIGGSTNFADYNPGAQYWDIMALDIYSDAYSNSVYYNSMLATAGGKPIAIGECFNLPSAASIDTYPRFAFFMNWAYGLKKGLSCENTNSDAFIQEVYNNPKVLTRDKMPGWKGVPANLATKKPVTVSSTEAGLNVAANITDGSYATRWSSLYTDTEWMYVDLQDTFTIEQIKITWETAMAKNYSIETSLDASTWTNLKTITNNTALINNYTGLAGKARYVRVYCTARATSYGYSIFEMEVYGKAISKPYSGTPISIPGTLQAENYDLGGEGVAFHDLNTGAASTVYRNDKVMIEACSDAGTGYNLADIQATEWTNYTVNVLTTRTYDFKLRVAAVSAGKTFHIEMDSVNITGAIAVPNTGGWQAWQTVTVPGITLTKGVKAMKVVMDSDLFNLNYVQIATPVITSLMDVSNSATFNIYPNPTTGMVNYELGSTGEHQIRLYDLFGRLVYSENTNNVKPISVAHLNKGVYVFEILKGNQKMMKKMILE